MSIRPPAFLLAFLLVLLVATIARAAAQPPKAGPPQPTKLGLLHRVAEQGVDEIVFAMRQRGKDPHWYANFSYYADDDQRLTYGNGGKLCRMKLATHAARAILDDPLGAVRDPFVHYDAQKILFSYRKGGTLNYHLYEIDIDGGNLRQLTDGPYDDIEPCYLPNGQIVFVSSRCKCWVNCWLTKVATMHRCEADGSNIRLISANKEHDNTPWPLPDGRILYQRWEYIDRSQVHYHHLWTSNPDGTAPMTFFGNQHPGTVMIDAKPIPDSRKIVAIFSPGHGSTEHDGFVTVVDPRKGPDEQSLARSVTRTGGFRDPWAFSEELFMAARGRQLLLMDGAGNLEEIYQATPAEAAAGLECHEPRPLVRRERERIIPDRTNPQKDTGTLVLLDAYKGRNMAGVKPGEIKKLLVLEVLPKPINFSGGMEPLTFGGSFTLERILGTVPVEPDGSATIELPALRPVFFVALDEHDMSVKRMQSFTSVQPGEVTSCIGCHEQRTETFSPGAIALAAARPPRRIQPISDCPDVFDFPRDIQPILDKLCVDCHGYDKTARGGPFAGGVILSGDHGPMYSHSYITMTALRLFSDNRNQPRSNLPPRAIGSSASRLLTMLDGTHYGVRADDHQRKMLRLWIEVGAPYPGTYAALGCGSVGNHVQNVAVNQDRSWPTTQKGVEVLDRRCASCHRDDRELPHSIAEDPPVYGRRITRHLVFNLSRAEKSLMLLAPLAEQAGGLNLCRDATGKPAAVLTDRNDPDYRTLLAMVEAGKQKLDEIKRFDMPGFLPCGPYLREMKHYGILPADHLDTAAVDPYDLDRRYWQSLWYQPQ